MDRHTSLPAPCERLTCNNPVGLVWVDHIHGAVHAHNQPRRQAPVYAVQVLLQPLQTTKLTVMNSTHAMSGVHPTYLHGAQGQPLGAANSSANPASETALCQQ